MASTPSFASGGAALAPTEPTIGPVASGVASCALHSTLRASASTSARSGGGGRSVSSIVTVFTPRSASAPWSCRRLYSHPMGVTVETGSTMEFDRFWRWLKRHIHCIVRAGTPDAFLYDLEDLHWHLDEDEDRTPVGQLMRGKELIGEVLIELRDVLYVQVMPDPDGEAGQHLFEVMGGDAAEPAPLFHFVLTHGLDESTAHRVTLKQ